MCGRYYVDDDTADEIRRIAKNTDFPVRTGDIRPSETTAVFSQRNGMLSVENMVWGYPGYQGKNLLIMETIDWVNEQDFACFPIYLFGLSMGAATARPCA